MSNPDFPLVGGCFCRTVRYEISAPPVSTGICHCESCRRIAGAESVGWAVNDETNFRFTKGEPRFFASSDGVERSFCQLCGTCLTYRYRPDQVDVTLASLDCPEALPPRHEVWCEDRLSWNPLNEALTHYQKGSGS